MRPTVTHNNQPCYSCVNRASSGRSSENAATLVIRRIVKRKRKYVPNFNGSSSLSSLSHCLPWRVRELDKQESRLTERRKWRAGERKQPDVEGKCEMRVGVGDCWCR